MFAVCFDFPLVYEREEFVEFVRLEVTKVSISYERVSVDNKTLTRV